MREAYTDTPGDVEFGPTADPDSLEIKIGDRSVGLLQRHAERPPQVGFITDSKSMVNFDLSILKTIVEAGERFIDEA
jgi:hypothetical protein